MIDQRIHLGGAMYAKFDGYNLSIYEETDADPREVLLSPAMYDALVAHVTQLRDGRLFNA